MSMALDFIWKCAGLVCFFQAQTNRGGKDSICKKYDCLIDLEHRIHMLLCEFQVSWNVQLLLFMRNVF